MGIILNRKKAKLSESSIEEVSFEKKLAKYNVMYSRDLWLINKLKQTIIEDNIVLFMTYIKLFKNDVNNLLFFDHDENTMLINDGCFYTPYIDPEFKQTLEKGPTNHVLVEAFKWNAWKISSYLLQLSECEKGHKNLFRYGHVNFNIYEKCMDNETIDVNSLLVRLINYDGKCAIKACLIEKASLHKNLDLTGIILYSVKKARAVLNTNSRILNNVDFIISKLIKEAAKDLQGVNYTFANALLESSLPKSFIEYILLPNSDLNFSDLKKLSFRINTIQSFTPEWKELMKESILEISNNVSL